MAEVKRVSETDSEHDSGVVVFEVRKDGGKREGTRGLQFIERATGQLADASEALTSTYAQRHRDSNTRKKDGWLRDLNDNVYEAVRAANDKIDVPKIFDL